MNALENEVSQGILEESPLFINQGSQSQMNNVKSAFGVNQPAPNFTVSSAREELELLEREITDPDLKLAIQFQREELERELLRKKQQEEDEKFAFELQNQADDTTYSVANSQTFEPAMAIETIQQEDQPLLELKNILDQAKDKNEIRIDEEDETCVVCLNDERNSVFVPCAHRSCCKDCAQRIFLHKGFCPLCWMTLEGVIDCQKISHNN